MAIKNWLAGWLWRALCWVRGFVALLPSQHSTTTSCNRRRGFLAQLAATLLVPASHAAQGNPLTFWRALLLVFAARSVGRATARGLGQGLARGLAPAIGAASKTFTKAFTPGRAVAGSMVAATAARPGLISRAMPIVFAGWLAYDLWKAAPALMAMFDSSSDTGPSEVAIDERERLVRVETQISNESDEPLAAVFEIVIASEKLVSGNDSEHSGEIARIVLGTAEIAPKSSKSLSAELNLSGLKGRYVAAPVAVFLGSDRAVPGLTFEPAGLLLDIA